MFPGLFRKSDVETHRDHGTKYGRDSPPRPSIRLWFKKFMGQGRDGCHLTKNRSLFFSVQPARDANANSNVKLLDQHHKLVEQNKVVIVMLILFKQLVMLIT